MCSKSKEADACVVLCSKADALPTVAKAWGRSFAPPGAGLRMTLPSMSSRGGSRVAEHEQPDRLQSAAVLGTVILSEQAELAAHSAVPPCRAAKDLVLPWHGPCPSPGPCRGSQHGRVAVARCSTSTRWSSSPVRVTIPGTMARMSKRALDAGRSRRYSHGYQGFRGTMSTRFQAAGQRK
jgi:hypothetical protein